MVRLIGLIGVETRGQAGDDQNEDFGDAHGSAEHLVHSERMCM